MHALKLLIGLLFAWPSLASEQLNFQVGNNNYQTQLVTTEAWQRADPVGTHQQGSIIGLPGSWIRISRHPSGRSMVAAFTGDNLYFQGEIRNNRIIEIQRRPADNAIPLLTNSAEQPELATFALERNGNNYRLAPYTLGVDLAVDQAFKNRYPHWNFELLAKLNMAAGILAMAAGVEIEPRVIYENAPELPTLRQGDLDSALDQLHYWRKDQLIASSMQASLLHYLSAEKPTAGPNGMTEGLTYNDWVCGSAGYDIGLSIDSVNAPWVIAHEISHSLGAKHDEQTRQCRNEDALMTSLYSNKTSISASACATDAMLSALNRSCFSPSTQPKTQWSANNQNQLPSASSAMITADLNNQRPLQANRKNNAAGIGPMGLFALLLLQAFRSVAAIAYSRMARA